MKTDYLVIGGGVVGLATAWRLQTMQPGSRVCLLEKEPEVGSHQSGHNSGVLHCDRVAELAVRSARRESFRSVASIINWLRAAKG